MHDGHLYIAWTSTGNNQLNVAIVPPGGGAFTSKWTGDDTSHAGPSLASLNGALATAEQTGAHLDEIAANVTDHLAAAALWRIEPSAAQKAYGMCGRLTMYPSAQAVRAT